jgi:hypothetical protein
MRGIHGKMPLLLPVEEFPVLAVSFKMLTNLLVGFMMFVFMHLHGTSSNIFKLS